MTPSGNLDDVLRQVAEIARPEAAQGEVADYIPALAAADADGFGICLTGLDGNEHAIGDVDVSFSIQSISKLFSLVLAMQLTDSRGGVREHLWSRVGREPSGDPFNSLVQLEREHGIPRNPMINAGALVVDDVLVSHCDDSKQSMLDLLEQLCGEPLSIDEQVFSSELETGHLNRAMASLLKSYDNLHNPVDAVLDSYVFACAVSMSTRQLARSIRFLANDGVEPDSGTRILSAEHARRVAAILLTCGTYDSAGEFAFNVGLPCKSGVSGGIVGMVPGRMGLCVWSPPLDDTGNSVAGRTALHELSRRLDLSVV
ncbi:MAG: glutaminase [Nitriliruptoraceae bacterium]